MFFVERFLDHFANFGELLKMRRAEAVVVGTFVVLLGLLYITKAHQQEIVEPREDSLGRNAIKFVVGGFRLWFGWIRSTFNENPGHVVIETIAIATIFYLLFQRRYDPASSLMLTAEEEEHLIRDWKPESLIPFDSDLSMESAKTLQKQSPLIESATLKGYVKANGGKTFLNLASNNFLGVSSHPSIIQVCKDTISKYGVGSCGPRGFYGTIDTHLKLEHDFARWLGVEDCILYSDGIACIASVIPAFAKKGDLLVW